MMVTNTTTTATYLLYPRSRVLPEKLTGSQLVKQFPAFYGTWRFITAVTSSRHLSLFWAKSIQSIPPYPTSWNSIFTLSSHLRMSLPSDLFPSGFPTKTLYTLLPSLITCHMHRPSHSSRFDHPNNIWWVVQIIQLPIVLLLLLIIIIKNGNYLIGPYHQQDIVGLQFCITKEPFLNFAPQLLVMYIQSAGKVQSGAWQLQLRT